MITPFTAEGSVDLDGAEVVATHLVDTGTDTLLLHGTTGETSTLHGEEAWDLLRVVRGAVGDRASIMMGTGSNDSAKMLELTRRAGRGGADSVLVVTPYYNRPDQRGLLQYFSAAAAATDLPVVLYDIPARSALEIAVDTLIRLAEIDNIVGVKDATADLGKAATVAAATAGAPGGFVWWSGADEVNLPLLALGAVGVVSVSSHLLGPELAEMVRVFPGDPARARELHLRCMPVNRALFAEPSPAPLKGAMRALGLPAGPVRPPLVDASDEAVDAVLAAYHRVKALR